MKYLFYFTLALLLTACRASKKIAEQSQALQTVELATDSLRAEFEKQTTLGHHLEELKNEAEDLNITITTFSLPDSVGQQHKTASATIRYNRKASRVTTQTDTLYRKNEHRQENTHKEVRSHSAHRHEREHKEKPPERWPYIIFGVITLAIGYGVYRKVR